MTLFYEFVIMAFIFSILGWIMEVTLKFIQYHRFINRGFLIGLIAPSMALGLSVLRFWLAVDRSRRNLCRNFMAGFVICGFLEYMTSFYMEKMFHARWWDYSSKPMNLNGRIWIGNLILFGLASLIIVKWIAPHYFDFIETWNPFLLGVFAWAILVCMLFDYVISHFLMNIVKKEIDTTDGDNTEEISIQVHALLQNKNLLLRRIYQAYPEFKVLPSRLTKKYKKLKKDYKTAQKECRNLLHQKFRTNFNSEQLKQAQQRLEEAYQELNRLTGRFKKRY